jgi:hypothetical protein
VTAEPVAAEAAVELAPAAKAAIIPTLEPVVAVTLELAETEAVVELAPAADASLTPVVVAIAVVAVVTVAKTKVAGSRRGRDNTG